jgi:mono/diheme cytochrome c family protein
MPGSTFSILNFVFWLACSHAAIADEKHPGQVAYVRACESCHGPSGRGAQGPPVVPYKWTLAELAAIIRQGIGLMPVIPRSAISDDEIALVHAYLKQLEDLPRKHENTKPDRTVSFSCFRAFVAIRGSCRASLD